MEGPSRSPDKQADVGWRHRTHQRQLSDPRQPCRECSRASSSETEGVEPVEVEEGQGRERNSCHCGFRMKRPEQRTDEGLRANQWDDGTLGRERKEYPPYLLPLAPRSNQRCVDSQSVFWDREVSGFRDKQSGLKKCLSSNWGWEGGHS